MHIAQADATQPWEKPLAALLAMVWSKSNAGRSRRRLRDFSDYPENTRLNDWTRLSVGAGSLSKELSRMNSIHATSLGVIGRNQPSRIFELSCSLVALEDETAVGVICRISRGRPSAPCSLKWGRNDRTRLGSFPAKRSHSSTPQSRRSG